MFGRSGQAQNQLLPGLHEFRGAALHELLKLSRLTSHVIIVRFDHQCVANSRDQVVGVDRLGEKVGGAQVQRLAFDFGIGGGGEDQYGDPHQLIVQHHQPHDVQAADARHVDVQQQQIGQVLLHDGHRLRRLGRRDEVLIAAFLQVVLDRHDVHGLVINDHDLSLLEFIGGDAGVHRQRTGFRCFRVARQIRVVLPFLAIEYRGGALAVQRMQLLGHGPAQVRPSSPSLGARAVARSPFLSSELPRIGDGRRVRDPVFLLDRRRGRVHGLVPRGVGG